MTVSTVQYVVSTVCSIYSTVCRDFLTWTWQWPDTSLHGRIWWFYIILLLCIVKIQDIFTPTQSQPSMLKKAKIQVLIQILLPVDNVISVSFYIRHNLHSTWTWTCHYVTHARVPGLIHNSNCHARCHVKWKYVWHLSCIIFIKHLALVSRPLYNKETTRCSAFSSLQPYVGLSRIFPLSIFSEIKRGGLRYEIE